MYSEAYNLRSSGPRGLKCVMRIYPPHTVLTTTVLLAETTVYCSETAYASHSVFRKNEASKKRELTIPKAIHLF